MSDDRLRHLLELAADPSPQTRGVLAGELRALLADWPAGYDAATRAPFEALLEKVGAAEPLDVLESARACDIPAVAAGLAALSGWSVADVHVALGETSGTALARLCDAAGLPHAGFSALAVLVGPARDAPLAVMERVLRAPAQDEAEAPRTRAA